MGVRKNLINILSPIGNEAEIDSYINSINKNIGDDYDKSSKYNSFNDDDWIEDFKEFQNIKYEELKLHFNRFK